MPASAVTSVHQTPHRRQTKAQAKGRQTNLVVPPVDPRIGAQRAVRVVKLLAGRKVLALGVHALVVVDIILPALYLMSIRAWYPRRAMSSGYIRAWSWRIVSGMVFPSSWRKHILILVGEPGCAGKAVSTESCRVLRWVYMRNCAQELTYHQSLTHSLAFTRTTSHRPPSARTRPSSTTHPLPRARKHSENSPAVTNLKGFFSTSSDMAGVMVAAGMLGRSGDVWVPTFGYSGPMMIWKV